MPLVRPALFLRTQGGIIIATDGHCEPDSSGAEFLLLFAAGKRPCAHDIATLLDGSGAPARVTHRPDEAEGWVELLASGLTFDLGGLAPAAAARPAPVRQVFGFPPASPGTGHEASEAISLVPGPHIAAGGALPPVIRVMAGLAAALAIGLQVEAIVWRPAGTRMAPAYFRRIIDSWLAGGAFPALGLVAVERLADGAMETAGLAFFIGQELRVDPVAGEPPAATARLVVRAIDHLVRHGPVAGTIELTAPDGEALTIAAEAIPAGPGGARVVVRRHGAGSA